MKERRVPHLHVEVFKGHSVPPQQLHGVPGHEAQSEEALHLVGAGPLGHLTTRREEGRRYDQYVAASRCLPSSSAANQSNDSFATRGVKHMNRTAVFLRGFVSRHCSGSPFN